MNRSEHALLLPDRSRIEGLSRRMSWLRSGLFWRTFLFLALLIAASMAAWIISYRVIERTPRATRDE